MKKEITPLLWVVILFLAGCNPITRFPSGPTAAPRGGAGPGMDVVLDNVLFDSAKTAIKPDGARILDRLAADMKANPGKRVELEGHTDSFGTDQYNQDLSERRAAAVKDYLVKKGVEASRISARGFGSTKPIAEGKSSQSNAKNRRVEVKVR